MDDGDIQTTKSRFRARKMFSGVPQYPIIAEKAKI
jgi:hypothetical protein